MFVYYLLIILFKLVLKIIINLYFIYVYNCILDYVNLKVIFLYYNYRNIFIYMYRIIYNVFINIFELFIDLSLLFLRFFNMYFFNFFMLKNLIRSFSK